MKDELQKGGAFFFILPPSSLFSFIRPLDSGNLLGIVVVVGFG
jgi:hypothetical protein